ncbi:hypothetical protein TRL7639_03541 [Falsiruegeria litorea R37]|uniref:Uncharacterized protein n=1 Tax=Falsiruegeria litorea R37 TaxID=1200284 RepID=A0A1Y5TLD8_9RHOB|nr:hypothetical protein [Falsiruegeria litorea]SLN63096.1 hypothetical protein TRL7639_03541 [Falsiruegeria litorea R37]
MLKTITLRCDHPELSDILEPGEQLLWSGQPVQGRRFFQAVGHERLLHTAFLTAVLLVWAIMPFAPDRSGVSSDVPFQIGVIVTLTSLAIATGLALARQFVLTRLAYFVSDKRTIICRRGRNWKLQNQLHITSSPRSDAVSPFGSLQIQYAALEGTAQPDLWTRVSASVAYGYVYDPQELWPSVSTSRNSTFH